MKTLTMSLLFVFAFAFLTADAYAIKDDSLMLYLPFEEGSGNVTTDLSGNKIQGELKGAKFSKDGKFGGCVSFATGTDYIEFPAADQLNITDQLTMEAWIFPEQSQADSSVLGRRSGPNVGGYCMQWHATDPNKPAVEAFVYVNGSWAQNGTRDKQKGSSELKKWHHAAITFDGNNLKQYIDGNLDATVAISGKINSVKEVFRVGQAQTTLTSMIGSVDEVAIYKKALSENEILEDMEKGVVFPVSPAGRLVATWGMIKGE